LGSIVGWQETIAKQSDTSWIVTDELKAVLRNPFPVCSIEHTPYEQSVQNSSKTHSKILDPIYI
jgi:hypothetical protein